MKSFTFFGPKTMRTCLCLVQIIWKGYTTFHYDGETGAFTGVSTFPCQAACRHLEFLRCAVALCA